MRRIGGVVAVVLLLSTQQADAREVYRVGLYQNPPKIFMDARQKPDGFFVTILDAIAKKRDWKLEYSRCSWSECLRQLESGKLDIMPDVAETLPRRERFIFSKEVVLSSWSAVYKVKGSKIESILDLDGKRIAVLKDSIQAFAIKERAEAFGITPRYVRVASFKEGLEGVKTGRAEAILINRFHGERQKKHYGLKKTDILIKPSELKFAYPFGREALAKQIDEELRSLKSDRESVYYTAKEKLLKTLDNHIHLPPWLLWSLGLVIGGFVISLVLMLVFRRMVEARTRELMRTRNNLRYIEQYDKLTHLSNRSFFVHTLEHYVARARQNKERLAVVLLDIDRFKTINDSLGHETGDRVLVTVAQKLIAFVHSRDMLARISSDEYALILSDIESVEEVINTVERIKREIDKPMQLGGHGIYINCSIGISFFPEDSSYHDELLKYADSALDRAKKDNRSSYQFYKADMTRQAFAHMELAVQMRRALENEEFEPHFQMQFDRHSGKLVGMEALIRWKHPQKGMVPPGKFIPFAEETGFILQLDEWMMHRCLRRWKAWQEAGYEPGRLSLNLSPLWLEDEGFIKKVQNALRQAQMGPESLALEVTETQIMKNPDSSIEKLKALADFGIEIAMDDFGTGYSSLAYLKRLPIDKLKIDQSFVRDIPGDQNDEEMVKAIIAMAKSFQLTVIAEGVETREQEAFLLQNGCEQIQGYLHHKPSAAGEVERSLRDLGSGCFV